MRKPVGTPHSIISKNVQIALPFHGQGFDKDFLQKLSFQENNFKGNIDQVISLLNKLFMFLRAAHGGRAHSADAAAVRSEGSYENRKDLDTV